MKQLIEDYKRRLATVKEEIAKIDKSKNDPEDITLIRLGTKASEYRTFIAELERLNVQNENVQNDNKSNPIVLITDETPQLISRIDFTTLRTQKKSLIKIIDEYELNKNVMVSKESEALDLCGILNLIDSIQDFAVDVMGLNPIDIFDFELEESREDVIKPEDVTKLTYSVITDDVINNIIERKKQGIDCTEEESAEIKGWLRELKLPEEQTHVATIQLLFPIEYGEFLDEV